ncbi:MAG: N-acetylneuraminate synthase family protein [Alphaproteobacteria bacterium]|nr:N-acetylneuraminate synthase family protein [Alphaproteobacteria bacterium]
MFTEGQRPYIIAEIGANHNGDLGLARKMIDAAKACGADAAKFQSWDTTLFSKSVYNDNYFLSDDYRNRTDHTLESIVDAFALTKEQLGELASYCEEVDIHFASTPFEPQQVDDLVELGAPFIKIASMDVNNDRLLSKAAATGKPVVLSTGMASLGEVDRAVSLLEASDVAELILLHCTALYPTPPEEVNLRSMETLRQFGHLVGFSDHSSGPEIALASVALGATVIEKHFTIDKEMFGWDHKISMDPDEMRILCEGAKRIHQALGRSRRVVGDRELSQRSSYRRSIIAARDLKAGQVLMEQDILYRRPGTGLDPSLAVHIVGMQVVRDIAYDTLIEMADLSPRR